MICIALCQILCDIRDNLISLDNSDGISNSEFQFLDNAHVVQGGTRNGSSINLNSIEDSHRIDKTCSAGRPFNVSQCGFYIFLIELECKRMSWVMTGSAEVVAIFNIVEHTDHTINRIIEFFTIILDGLNSILIIGNTIVNHRDI